MRRSAGESKSRLRRKHCCARIRPTRPETGYGYIEAAGWKVARPIRKRRRRSRAPLHRKARPRPSQAVCGSGQLLLEQWHVLWRADTLANALREHLPKTAPLLEQIAAAYGTRKFADTFRKLYPKCENISIDYAVLEPRSAKGEAQSRIFCLPADFGWNDLGSWSALHEHRVGMSKAADGSMISASGSFSLNAKNNYVRVVGKFVALVGVSNLVIVETEDALLVTTLDQSQDVGKVVKHLDEKKLKKLV